MASVTREATKPAKKKATSNLKAPEIAWPTLALMTGAWLGWATLLVGALAGAIEPWIALVLNAPLAFALFTPMHDASHKSLTRVKWPNEVIGRLCSLAMTAPFPAFRYLHLTHHKHTNHDHEDPDMWSGRGPWFVLPLRWLTQDLHYYTFYFARWSERPVAERRETAASLSAFALIAALLCWTIDPVTVFFAWLIPARLAIAFLAFAFDYLPHRPHTVTSKEDRYQATSVRPNPLLTPLFLYQNYHLIHHLYPGVPFYRYAVIWREREEKLRAKGAKVIE